MLRLILAVSLLGADPTNSAAGSPEALDLFENEIRPLLARNCFKCHGVRKQESGLRLDHVTFAVSGGSRGPALVTGDAGASLIVAALRQNGELKMPPGGPLAEREIRAVERWIELGAPWSGEKELGGLRLSGDITPADRAFWSFRPIARPTPPEVEDTSWPQTPIDRFILARIESAGIQLAPPASKRTLLRRVTYDLSGLPPTPEALRDYLEDDAPDAFARVVDRLLASPSYGERWGRHWLDVVRYADTAGETADYPVREAYRYRNYVIDSLNSDKPYDEFVREQIAGDVLAREGPRELYAERTLGTGFIGISRRFGYDSERYQYLTIQDTIDTVGQTFLGLSLGCARCHHHKFDPVSMEDYYGLYGIFASSRYAFPGSEEKKRVRSMVPLLPPDEAAPLRERFEARVSAIEQEMRELKGSKIGRFGIKSLDDIDGDFERQAPAQGGSEGLPRAPWKSHGRVSISEAAISPYTTVHPVGTAGVSLAGDRADNWLSQYFPRALRRGDGTFHLNVEFQVVRSRPVVDRQGSPAGKNEPEVRWKPESVPGRYRFFLGEGRGDSAAFSFLINADGFMVNSDDDEGRTLRLKPDIWYSVQVALDLDARSYTGSIGVPGDRANFSGRIPTAWSGTIDHLMISGEPSVGQLKPHLHFDNIALRRSPLAPPTWSVDLDGLLDKKGKKPAASDTATLSPEAARRKQQAAESRVAELDAERAALINDGPYASAYGVVDGYGEDAHVQERGDPLRRGRSVPRRFLAILGGDRVPEDVKGSGRLQLAQWLTREQNPLTARVIVNRLWQHHFGDGLVRTENDFGKRGEAPSHPQLLDYLASRLMESDWSLKTVQRLMLLSATYRVSAQRNDSGPRLDPEVKLHWRFRRKRLDAESLRDSILFLGGHLDRAMGGCHPFPSSVKKAYSQHRPFRGVYPTRKRSVYLMTQRTKMHPYIGLFDGSDPNATTAKRSASIVPTQALFLMNSEFVHEQSRGFARQLMTASSSPEGRITLAYERALARPPSAKESERAMEFLATYAGELGTSRDDSLSGDARPRGRLIAQQNDAVQPAPDPSLESLAAFARTLFSRNEFLYVE